LLSKSGCEQSRQTSAATHLAADLSNLLASFDQLDQQPTDVTQCQPPHFRFTESSYRKYLPENMKNLIGQVDVGSAGILAALFYICVAWWLD